jgi:phosphatidylserine decarboxylase
MYYAGLKQNLHVYKKLRRVRIHGVHHVVVKIHEIKNQMVNNMKTLLFTESPDIVTFLLILFILQFKYYIYVYTLIMSFLVYFYRFPKRLTCSDNNIIISPCDGTVLDVVCEDDTYRIIVYLSIWDVHTQWYPVNGRIVDVLYKPGEFNLAHVLEKSNYNERCSTVIQHEFGLVQVDQIAGQVARRVVNRSRIGSIICQGDYMGMIKLSSRVDIIVPSHTRVLVKRNDKVKGNTTIISQWNN